MAGLGAIMRTSSFGYLIKEGFRSIKENRVISFAAIGVLATCLLLVGASYLFSLNLNEMIGYFESQNEVLIYLDDDLGEAGIERIEEELHATQNVRSVTFISKDQGLEDWMEELGDDGTLLEWLRDDNPLQDSFCVVLGDLSQMEETLDVIRAIHGVDTVSASAEVSRAVTALKTGVSTTSLGIIAILAVVSLLIIANTIRLTVYNRRKEISIMKYVGATDSFIRLPFLTEGILIGFIAGTLGFFLLWGCYELLGHYLTEGTFEYASVLLGSMIPFRDIAPRLYACYAGGGALIGGLGSSFAVGKYVKV